MAGRSRIPGLGAVEEALGRKAADAIEGAMERLAVKKKPAPAPRKAAPPAEAAPLAVRPAPKKPAPKKPSAAPLAVRPAPKKPVPKKPAAPRSTMTTTPDLRVLDTPGAIAVARGEPHLIQDTSGQYVGGPRGVTTPEHIAAMRQAFDADVAAGADGADWYTRAREFNREVAGPDPARQQLLSDEEALWSAQATPDTNMNFALQGHNAYEMGQPLDLVRTGQQARTYNDARDAGQRVPLGAKTGVYGQHLDPTVPYATTGTNDIWHARGFGYSQEGRDQFSRALSPQEHRFLDYETMLAVDRANQAQLGGRGDWGAHEIQAAPWVAGKGRALAEQRGLPAETGIGAASMTYPDYADKYTAFGTYEQTPYVSGGHLQGLATGSEADRLAFSADPRGSWTDGEGRDAIYDALGMYQRPTQDATGVYQPPGGALELNPASVARPLVGMREGAVDPASRGAMDLAEGLRAYMDVQGAGAWHKPVLNAKPGGMGSVFTPHEGAIDADTLMSLKAMGERYGLPDIIDTGQGATMTAFYPSEPPPGAVTGKHLKGGLENELSALLSGDPRRASIDSGYQSMFEAGSPQGSGEMTDALRALVMQYPDSVRAKLDASPGIRQAARGKAERDVDWSQRTGQPIREDVQRARQIVGDEGLSGLFAARDRGVPLPSIIIPTLTAGGLGATALGSQQQAPGE